MSPTGARALAGPTRASAREVAGLARELQPLLRAESGIPLDREYPLLFHHGPFAHHFTIRDGEGLLLSHAALLVRHLVCGNRRLRIGMISNLVTRPESRRRGLAGALVEQCLARMVESRCAVALAWSDRESFYSRYGFERMGRESIFHLEGAALPTGEPHPLEKRHLPGLFSLHEAKLLRVERNPAEMTRLLAIPRMEVFVLEGAESRPLAYLCLGKGEDFRGFVHECGGAPADLVKLLGGLLRRRRPALLPLLLSPLDRSTGLLLARGGATRSEGALGLGRVLDRAALAAFAAHLGPLASRLEGPEPFLPFYLEGLDSV